MARAHAYGQSGMAQQDRLYHGVAFCCSWREFAESFPKLTSFCALHRNFPFFFALSVCACVLCELGQGRRTRTAMDHDDQRCPGVMVKDFQHESIYWSIFLLYTKNTPTLNRVESAALERLNEHVRRKGVTVKHPLRTVMLCGAN